MLMLISALVKLIGGIAFVICIIASAGCLHQMFEEEYKDSPNPKNFKDNFSGMIFWLIAAVLIFITTSAITWWIES